MTKRELLKNWKNLICLRSKLVDPDEEYTWEALFLGMAIAYGFDIDNAKCIYSEEGYELEYLADKKEWNNGY